MWGKFKGLKPGQKAFIVVGLMFFALISAGSQSSTSTDKAKPLPSNSVTSPPKESASPSVSPTPSESSSPESPIEFRFAVLRDLKDMRKDIEDARKGISGDGLGKFYWNVSTITFNLVQLETRVPKEEYAESWNQKLEILKLAVRDLGTGDDELTISSAKAQLTRVLNAIPALERLAKSLAN